MTERDRTQVVSFVILVAALTAIAIGLAALTFMATRAVEGAEGPHLREFLARLAWLSLALLCLTLLLLLWSVARFFRPRLHRGESRSATPYVNAWALAGQRFELDEDDEDEDEDDPDDRDGPGDQGCPDPSPHGQGSADRQD